MDLEVLFSRTCSNFSQCNVTGKKRDLTMFSFCFLSEERKLFLAFLSQVDDDKGSRNINGLQTCTVYVPTAHWKKASQLWTGHILVNSLKHHLHLAIAKFHYDLLPSWPVFKRNHFLQYKTTTLISTKPAHLGWTTPVCVRVDPNHWNLISKSMASTYWKTSVYQLSRCKSRSLRHLHPLACVKKLSRRNHIVVATKVRSAKTLLKKDLLELIMTCTGLYSWEAYMYGPVNPNTPRKTSRQEIKDCKMKWGCSSTIRISKIPFCINICKKKPIQKKSSINQFENIKEQEEEEEETHLVALSKHWSIDMYLPRAQVLQSCPHFPTQNPKLWFPKTEKLKSMNFKHWERRISSFNVPLVHKANSRNCEEET